MSSNVNWSNPYAKRDGQWFKGNLHTHTNAGSGCGKISVQDCLDRYVELGYDFVAISDHMFYKRYKDPRITILPGVEWNAPNGYHTGVVSLSASDVKTAIGIHDQDELLKALADTGALVILNHPNWQLRSHYRREELEARTNFDGIEIYNGVIERLQGYAISTDKWDYLLAKGIKCLGFACDDSHNYTDIGLASMCVRAKDCKPASIIRAMKAGNFYCSSGATIDDIRLSRGVIEIETPDAQEIQVRADGGKMIHRVFDKSIRFNTRDFGTEYVRFAIFGQGASMAWTQPFFLKKD
jgi:histidinol phosphatase-like PHP family hydrolase